MKTKLSVKQKFQCNLNIIQDEVTKLDGNGLLKRKRKLVPVWVEQLVTREEMKKIIDNIWNKFMIHNEYEEKFINLNLGSQNSNEMKTRLNLESRLKVTFDIYGVCKGQAGILWSDSPEGTLLLEDPRIWVIHIKNNLLKEDFLTFILPLIRHAMKTATNPQFIIDFFLKVIPHEFKLEQLEYLSSMHSQIPKNIIFANPQPSHHKGGFVNYSSSDESKFTSQDGNSVAFSENNSMLPALGEKDLPYNNQPFEYSEGFEKTLESFDLPEMNTVMNLSCGQSKIEQENEDEFMVINRYYNNHENFSLLKITKNDVYVITPRKIFKTSAARKIANDDYSLLVSGEFDYSDFIYVPYSADLVKMIDSDFVEKFYGFSFD